MTPEELNRYTGLILEEAEANIWILAGQQVAEGYTNRTFSYGERTEQFAVERGGGSVLLSAYPLDMSAPVTVALDGEERGDYVLYQSGLLSYGRGLDAGTLSVTYSGGYRPHLVPEPIKIAVALIAGALKSAGQSDGQQIVSEKLDGYSVTYAQTTGIGLQKLAPAAAALLRPYIAKAW